MGLALLRQSFAVGLELGERTRLISLREARVTDHIGGEDGGEPTLNAFHHYAPPREHVPRAFYAI